MEASLTCAVCLGVFREPVTLPSCSHNFCKGCVLDCCVPKVCPVSLPGRDGLYTATSVSCPLCRKVSSIAGGLESLPVNTTLAEIVRHLALTSEPGKEPVASGDLELSSSGRGSSCCPEHPELKLQLFCRNCAQACCAKCVSSKHQGIFHNVNLMDMTYQEEKLMLFSSLKRLREVHEKLTKKTTDEDIEKTLQKNTAIVTSAFDEVQKALDLKKQQLLDFIKQQQSTAMKRNEVRKVTQAHHLKTVGSLLQDCENVVDESEPKCFLQVACDLNKRMKSSLDLMELSTDNNEDSLKPELHCVELQTALEAISALKITSSNSNDFLTKVNGNFFFNTITRTWKGDILYNEKYSPVQNQELYSLQGQLHKRVIRFVSITQMPEYQHMSYEELRMKYYGESAIQESEPQRSVLPNNSWNFNLQIPGREDIGLAFESACLADAEPFPKRTELQEHNKSGACIVKHPNTSPGKVSRYSLEGCKSSLSLDTELVKETKFNNLNRKVSPSFCLGRSDVKAVTKSNKTVRFGKKHPTADTLPAKVEAGNTVATTDRPFAMFQNTTVFNDVKMPMASPFFNPFHVQTSQKQANEVPEDGSSEEYYDANSNTNSDVEETCGQMNTHDCKDNKSQPSQKKPH